MPRGTQDTASHLQLFRLQGYHLLRPAFPCLFSYNRKWYSRSPATPVVLTTGLGSSPFARHYSGNLLLISSPPGTEMFHFPGSRLLSLCVQLRMIGFYPYQVSPFGNPRINACSAAPRGFSQPATSFIAAWCQGIHRAPLLT